ncbi:glucan phosphoethanolaminetransferase (alkaline phosphatase superfamily) [Staphylococcus caledonicus]|uniref:hypothetical protein n=1 Tax=Staphylococcus TaxID=1279 RepID=UPI001F57DC6B|nr:hypothetical protein [Staphylococcus sp. acrmy]MCI2947897.1 hypothetical protein [Staphylococcus sp. acrmy]
MQKLVKKSAKISLIFGVLFFLLNYFSAHHDTIDPLLIRSLIATIAFFILYIVVFSIFNSDERKLKFGITLPIALVIFLIIGGIFFTVKIGLIIGLIVGIIAGFIWEWMEKRNGGTK